MSVYDQWSQDSCCEEIFGGEGICSFHQHHHRHHHRLCLIDFKYFKIAPTHIVESYWLNRILVWVRVLHDFKMAWVLPREFEVVRSTFGWLVVDWFPPAHCNNIQQHQHFQQHQKQQIFLQNLKWITIHWYCFDN